MRPPAGTEGSEGEDKAGAPSTDETPASRAPESPEPTKASEAPEDTDLSDLSPPKRKPTFRRTLLRSIVYALLVVALFVGGGTGLAYWAYERHRAPGPLASEATVVIPSGAGLNAISNKLAEAGIVANARLFQLAARLKDSHTNLKAGEYRFAPGVSEEAVLEKLIEHDVVLRFVTVPEGLTSRQIVAILEETEALSGTVEDIPPEGSLLPETYDFHRGEARTAVLARMRAAMDETLDTLWPARAEDLPVETKEEAVILASIVEKETALASERPRVASVFVNRLRRGMRLQSDPTVVYALTDGAPPLDRALTRQDWKLDHPYNTYRIAGLPPGPIANPGRASIEAVLHPAETDDLYFVADGNGGHAFAETLAEHNRNVAKWRRIKRNRSTEN